MDLVVVGADGSLPLVVAQMRSVQGDGPRWSPDGNSISFTGVVPGNNWCPDIFTVQPDGANRRELTAPCNALEGPRWSPDEQRLLFAAYQAAGSDLFVMNGDGTGLTNLTNDAAFDLFPTRSPNGNLIA